MIEFKVGATITTRPTEFKGLEVGECFVEAGLAEGTECKHRGIWIKNNALCARRMESVGTGATVKFNSREIVYRVRMSVEAIMVEEGS